MTTASSRTAQTQSTPPHVLREYALLADGERGAVVGPRGDIVWMCAPHWDSPSVFSALIGGHGVYSVAPDDTFVWGGSYDEGSMIWRSRWVTRSGIVECREALSYPAEPRRVVLLRQVRAVDCTAHVTVRLVPHGGYDTEPMTELHRHDGVWTARIGRLHLRLSGAGDASPREHRHSLELHLEVQPERHHDLVLEIADHPLIESAPDPDDAWRATERAWRDAVPTLAETLNPPDTRRSYAVLRGLTRPGGGMVAAATTSLPERAEAGRNYDYRYVWIRDQCYAGQAIASVGPDPLLDDAVHFVAERLLADGDRLAPAYTLDGTAVPDQRHVQLPGYPGGYDIVGNWVNSQFQLDAFGEALLLLAAAERHDRLDTDHWRAARVAADAIAKRWTEPDAGIWELDNEAWTHSRLTAAAGLRAIAAAVHGDGSAGDWLALADRIVADTAERAVHPDGHWQRTPDDPHLDAALLLAGIRGATTAQDPRAVKTFEAYLRELTEDGYAYRFRHDARPLADAEGSFLLCGFLVALAHHQYGNSVHARSWYDTTRAAVGPAQLFSEEYDVRQHQMRGNLPQAFVHALHLETASRLASDPSHRMEQP